MKRSISRFWQFGLLGLAWFGLTGEGYGWERIPISTNHKIEIHFEVRLGPTPVRPAAPWYAYFPADPRMAQSQQTSPYPPWPGTFPPSVMPPANGPGQGQVPNTNIPRAARVTQLWPGQDTYGMNLQPVGYHPAQAPSYWYRNP